MILRCLASFLIYLTVQLPASLIAWPCLAIALLTKWDGSTLFFGNSKWGRATNHYLVPTNGEYLKELLWMAWRNPVYNLGQHVLSVKMKPWLVVAKGDENIGDKIAGGFYSLRMGKFWEFYYIKSYTFLGQRRCVRARIGWKISGNTTDLCEYVFSINPFKDYTGK